MAKIIDGLLYDLDEAEEIAANRGGGPWFPDQYAGETLYRTPNGRFFLNRWGGFDDSIVRLSEDETRVWLERNDSVAEYIELFGEPERA